MPPRAKRAAEQPDTETSLGSDEGLLPTPAIPELCPECFPNGWAATAAACGCVHGSWTREATD